MRTKRTAIFLGLGVLFLLYAILVQYLLWVNSFKIENCFTILGAVLKSSMSSFHIWLVTIIEFVYITFAYIPMPEPASIVFGLAGGGMTLIMVYVVWRWARERDKHDPKWKNGRGVTLAAVILSNFPGITMWITLFTTRLPEWEGIIQRLGLVFPLIWMEVMAIKLLNPPLKRQQG